MSVDDIRYWNWQYVVYLIRHVGNIDIDFMGPTSY